MQEQSIKNIKLGVFVIAGLLLLIWLLYLIGTNRNLFGAHFELKATFNQVNGLEVGNNVRFAGINAGTVDAIEMINDSTVEVTMLMNSKFKGIIKTNAEAGISTDGLVGNKIINISTNKREALIAKTGDFIAVRKNTDTEEMIRTLAISNENVRKISDTLLLLISALKNSPNMNYLTDDVTFKQHVSRSLQLIDQSMSHLYASSKKIEKVIADAEDGKGNLGKLLKDTLLISHIDNTVLSINQASTRLVDLIDATSGTVKNIDWKIKNTNNSFGKLLNDTAMGIDMSEAIHNINESARHFDEVMLALQHSIFLRKYFRKSKESNDNQ